jgi:O-antigen/teichoic acid export membrane protein
MPASSPGDETGSGARPLVPDAAAGRDVGDDPSAMSAGHLQERAVRGAAWTVVHTFVAIPVAFLVNLVVARVLGSADYGRLALLTAIMEFVSGLLTTGFATAVIQFGAKAHAAGRTADVARLLSQWQGFRLVVAMPVLLVVVLVMADVPPWAMGTALLFGVVLPSLLDGGATSLGIENKTADGAKIALVTTLLTQAVVVVVALAVRTPDAVWATRLVVTGLAVGLCLLRIAPQYRGAVLRPALPRGLPVGFWRFAVPMGLAGVVSGLVSSRSEVFVMSWLATPEALGIYALSFGLAVHAFAPAQAIVGPLIPAISGLREIDETAVAPAFRRVVRSGATVVALVDAAAVAPLALLVPVLYGHQFADASPVVLVLAVTSGVATAGGPVFAFVTARLSGRPILVAYLVALVVDLGLAVALVPSLGVWGAVVANAGGALTSLGILAGRELRALRLPLRVVLHDAVPLAVGSLSAVGAYLVGAAMPGPVLLRAVAAGVVGTAVCVGVLRLVGAGLTVDDRGAVDRVLPARVRRPASKLLDVLLGGATRTT